MKTITVSDKDYETLMELSKELQTQDNHHQGFPYYWVPRSTQLKPSCVKGEGGVALALIDGETYDLEDLVEYNEEWWLDYLKEECDTEFYRDYKKEDEDNWFDWLRWNTDLEFVYENYEKIEENNPSLFLSDVQDFIKYNKHHLGDKPHTYARTIFRMHKMEELIKCLLRLNPQSKEKEKK